MRSSLLFSAVSPFLVLGAPAPSPVAAPAPLPQDHITDPLSGLVGGVIQTLSLQSALNLVPALLGDIGDVLEVATTVSEAIANGTIAGTDVPAVVQKLYRNVKPSATPTSIPDAIARAASSFDLTTDTTSSTSQDLLGNALGLVLNGFTSADITAVANGANPFTNSYTNNNPVLTGSSIFYNRVKGDAPFSVPTAKLRAAMYIPPGFTKGKKQPVLMSPGTGATGGINFESNIGKLLSAGTVGDPVYLNIPSELLDDAQISAEYVSYALQYLYHYTSVKPAIITWSQGSIDTQWAYKYWPSLTHIVTDHVAISPDYHGTILAAALCPGANITTPVCVPSIIQQRYNSNFVTQLRKSAGDSAYVPTTTVYSGLDEIVEPQQGTAASGFLKDARKVGVSNTFLQGACAGQPAAGLYTHEGVLYNPVAYALVIDALTHAGPGSFERVKSSCADIVAPGLSLADVLETESLIPLAVLNIASYLPKTGTEPAIAGYASY